MTQFLNEKLMIKTIQAPNTSFYSIWECYKKFYDGNWQEKESDDIIKKI